MRSTPMKDCEKSALGTTPSNGCGAANVSALRAGISHKSRSLASIWSL